VINKLSDRWFTTTYITQTKQLLYFISLEPFNDIHINTTVCVFNSNRGRDGVVLYERESLAACIFEMIYGEENAKCK
jgi:hypothetical protein